MTIHVNIGEAKTRLSGLIAAALRGEEVIVDKSGEPQVMLVPVAQAQQARREEIAARRKAAFGALAAKYAHLRPEDSIVPPSMTDEELEERFQRKFGAASS
jgi:prevent-host-death family protein